MKNFIPVLPEEGPKISGGKARYQVGENVDINCTSGFSRPPVKLFWMINGDSVDPEYLIPYPPLTQDELESTILGLNFKVKAKHFKKGDMKLKVSNSIICLFAAISFQCLLFLSIKFYQN